VMLTLFWDCRGPVHVEGKHSDQCALLHESCWDQPSLALLLHDSAMCHTHLTSPLAASMSWRLVVEMLPS
jgi:hypothetical protein